MVVIGEVYRVPGLVILILALLMAALVYWIIVKLALFGEKHGDHRTAGGLTYLIAIIVAFFVFIFFAVNPLPFLVPSDRLVDAGNVGTEGRVATAARSTELARGSTVSFNDQVSTAVRATDVARGNGSGTGSGGNSGSGTNTGTLATATAVPKPNNVVGNVVKEDLGLWTGTNRSGMPGPPGENQVIIAHGDIDGTGSCHIKKFTTGQAVTIPGRGTFRLVRVTGSQSQIDAAYVDAQNAAAADSATGCPAA